MKVITNYSFDASAKKVTFNDYATIQIERIVKITNLTQNKIIYNNTNQLGSESVTANYIILDAEDVKSMSDTDKLQILYEDDASEDRVYKTLVDEADASTTYIGEAMPNADPTAAVWRITLVDTSTNPTTIQFADGDSNFDNVWDDRAALSYN